jgi:polysaccharide pyruvyl transferase WcaK-like protein
VRVLIQGVNSINKGAELLLVECVRRLSEQGHVPLVSVKDFSRGDRRRYGAAGYVSRPRLRALRSLGLDLLPARVAGITGCYSDRHVEAVIDASGFSLTDAWGPGPATQRLTRMARWRGRDVKYIMVPQAVGPFDRGDVQEPVRAVLKRADLIWLRDTVSQAHARALFAQNEAPEMKIAPDITISLKTDVSDEAQGRVILVPNWNIAKRGDATAAERYSTALAEIVVGLRRRGHEVIGLSHEGREDAEILRQVDRAVGGLVILEPRSGIECKQVIGGAKLLVGGRYHSVVSALAHTVPAIAHSWSHKYKALMDDFALPNRLADPYDSAATLDLVDQMNFESETAHLAAVLPTVQDRIETVWRDVELVLQAK